MSLTELVHSDPSMDVLVPMERQGDPSSTVSLLCLISGVEPSQTRVYWEVEQNFQSPEFIIEVLSGGRTDIRVQVSVPGHSWARDAEVTCVLESYGGLRMKKSVSRMGKGFLLSSLLRFVWMCFFNLCKLKCIVLIKEYR